jgi:hypothetical protein
MRSLPVHVAAAIGRWVLGGAWGAAVSVAAAAGTAPQAITFPVIAEKVYGDPPVTLNASASSGLPVSYALISGNGIVSGSTVTLNGGGAIVVEATQPGNETYAAAPAVRQTITVKPRTVTISVPSPTVAFTGFSQSVDSMIVSNPSLAMNGNIDRLIVWYNGQPVNAPTGGTPTNTAMLGMYPRGAGVYNVRVDAFSQMQRYTGTTTATLTITRMPVTLTLGNLTQVYDGAAKSVSVTTTPTEVYYPSGAQPMTRYLKVTYNGSATAPTEPGAYDVVAVVDSPDVTGTTHATLTIARSGPPQTPPSGPSITTPNPPAVVPPAAPTPPSTPPPPAVAVTAPPARSAQTIEFLAPVSVPVMGQPFPLGATSSAGLPITFAVVNGSATIRDNVLVVTGPGPVVVRASQAGNETMQPASAEITISGARRMAQSVSFAPPSSKLSNEAPFVLVATATSGLPVAFTLVSGPASLSGDTLTLNGASGTVVVRAAQAGNETTEPVEVTRTITVEAAPSSRLANVSARLQVSDDDANRTFISGFVVAGTAAQRVLIRATGPALAAFGVRTPLANPRLRLFDVAGHLIEENDDWNGADISATAGQVGAFPLSVGSHDAAIVRMLSPGAYTVHIMAGGGAGVALAEIFDASDATGGTRPPLVNLSTRGYVDTGEAQMGAGFVIAGPIDKRVLVRAVGPTLGSLGVTSALRDPTLTVYKSETIVARNDDWEIALPLAGVVKPAGPEEIPAATAASGAFALPAGSRDSALVLVLAPGAYTALVSGANGATGVALIEVYELP